MAAADDFTPPWSRHGSPRHSWESTETKTTTTTLIYKTDGISIKLTPADTRTVGMGTGLHKVSGPMHQGERVGVSNFIIDFFRCARCFWSSSCSTLICIPVFNPLLHCSSADERLNV